MLQREWKDEQHFRELFYAEEPCRAIHPLMLGTVMKSRHEGGTNGNMLLPQPHSPCCFLSPTLLNVLVPSAFLAGFVLWPLKTVEKRERGNSSHGDQFEGAPLGKRYFSRD